MNNSLCVRMRVFLKLRCPSKTKKCYWINLGNKVNSSPAEM